jgi:GntP family gluconate:H+ symporter
LKRKICRRPAIETDHLPAGWKAVLPILLPIVLIGIGATLKFLKIEGGFTDWLIFFGHPMIALFIGLIASFSLFPKWEKEYTTDWIGEGIKLAGPILIITGAGGAFGGVLKATPLADQLGAWISAGQSTGAVFLILAFAIAAVLKTAQGSSTNALVITSSMLAPLVIPMGFDTPFEMALVVMALGGGAMTVSHANDSYFWVVSQFSGIQVADAYRSYTLLTGLQGLVVLITTLILYSIGSMV